MNKAQQVLNLFSITEEAVKEILNVNDKYEVDNYPYGSLRTKAYFWMEFKPKKGFRNGFQTINPKNGRLNAPKYGTYSDFAYLYKDDKGHIQSASVKTNGLNFVQDAVNFLIGNQNKLQLTGEMIKHIVGSLLVHMKISTQYITGDNKAEIIEYIKPAFNILNDVYKTGDISKLKDISIDYKKIDDLAY